MWLPWFIRDQEDQQVPKWPESLNFWKTGIFREYSLLDIRQFFIYNAFNIQNVQCDLLIQ